MADEAPSVPVPPASDQPPPEADSLAVAAPIVSVTVTESDSTAKTGKEEPCLASASDSSAMTEKEEKGEFLPPPSPHPILEVAESEPEEVAEKVELPQPVVAESKSLAAMMEKDEPGAESQGQAKSAADTTQEDVDVAAEERKIIPRNLVSFKEESNKLADLSDFERNALQELKQLVQEALDTHQFTSPPPKPPSKDEKTAAPSSEAPEAEPGSDSDKSTEINPPEENPEKETKEAAKPEPVPPAEVSIWGIPLLKDDRSDVIFLKFLRARDFKVRDAFAMIKNTIQWRKEFGIDKLVEENLGDDLEKVVFMHGHDRDGHPVCYNVYGEFQNKELYQKTFSDEEKRMKFLRWRIQFLERSIRKLDFSPGGICTIFQVNDLQNSPGPGKRELRLATKQALQLLQDNYPEFVAKQVFINVPWWYLAFYTMISPFMTQRTKSKFVFAGPAKTAETLFKYISPEQVPIQYGGLSVDYCDCNPEFSFEDTVTEITVKSGTKKTVEITIYEKCILVWEIRVVGWEVSYGAEFVPNAKDSYTIIIQKPTKMAPRDEPVVSHSFKVGDLGKVLLTVDNPTSKKKKLLYRFKVKPFSD
ncbi:hypothetical protein SLE2022_237180 [Rubroshorea leprosula]